MDIIPPNRKRQSVISDTRPAPVARPVNPGQPRVVPRPSIAKETPLQKKQRSKKRIVRWAIVAINIMIFGAVGYLVIYEPNTTIASYGANNQNQVSNPLDSLSSVDIAANIARLTGMPEALAVNNQANTTALTLNATVIAREFVSKAQILSPEIKSKEDIIKYVVKEGDTLGQLAKQFGVTSDSIIWSNDIRGDLPVGNVIYIPPINGIVHQVGVSDTPRILADRYSASADAIIAFNDAELSGLVLGQRIVIPNGIKPSRLSDIANYRASYGYNGYLYGYCTWYIANRIEMPNNWGDANMWDNYARVTPGWTVSQTPVPGAIAQTNRGPWGHVGIVEEVSEDGTMIKFSDMNGAAGWNRVYHSPDWVTPDAGLGFENFIYRVGQ